MYAKIASLKDNILIKFFKNNYYQELLANFYNIVIDNDSKLLIIGSKIDFLINNFKTKNIAVVDPKYLDLSLNNIENKHFDYIIIHSLPDAYNIQELLTLLNKNCNNKTRIILDKSSLSYGAINDIAYQSDFQIVISGKNILLPFYIPGISWLFNNVLAHLPIINFFCLRQWYILRKLSTISNLPSVSVIVPCRNEKGNIESIVNTMPKLCDNMEIIFIEGHSKDGTLDEIKRVIEQNTEKNIQYYVQANKGKNDAVQLGFEKANGDILMILDADLTVQAKDLSFFYQAISSNKAEFVNGSRLVYPIESKAMPWLNFFANHFFARLVSWVLNQKVTDTLCGTKVLYKKDYEKIKNQRDFFSLSDPFGDFDLLFGAAKLNLKIVDVPIKYKARTYGTTQVKKFINGLILLKMCIMGFIKFKRK